jgi:hypothetical protein
MATAVPARRMAARDWPSSADSHAVRHGHSDTAWKRSQSASSEGEDCGYGALLHRNRDVSIAFDQVGGQRRTSGTLAVRAAVPVSGASAHTPAPRLLDNSVASPPSRSRSNTRQLQSHLPAKLHPSCQWNHACQEDKRCPPLNITPDHSANRHVQIIVVDVKICTRKTFIIAFSLFCARIARLVSTNTWKYCAAVPNG